MKSEKKFAKLIEQYLVQLLRQQRRIVIHNHFETGCSAQVFNDKVNGKFTKTQKKKWKKKKNVTQQAAPPVPPEPPAKANDEYPVAMLVECVDEVRDHFWGDNSPMAVIFCVCRDCYNYPDNMSQFERDFGCKAGVVSNTFGDNPYMYVSSEKWPTMHVKQRVLSLVEAYKCAVLKHKKT